MSEYNTNQDGQWKTSEQWRAEEANDHSNPKKNIPFQCLLVFQ